MTGTIEVTYTDGEQETFHDVDDYHWQTDRVFTIAWHGSDGNVDRVDQIPTTMVKKVSVR